jgi:uncharacterized membrane protein
MSFRDADHATVLGWARAIAVAGLALLMPIGPIIGVAVLLIFADLFTGVWAARKRGERISSAALGRTVSKLVVYLTAIITSYLVEHVMLQDTLPISKLAGSAIGLVEMKSLIENFTVILGKDLFRAILAKLGSTNDAEKPPEPKP